VPASSSCLPGPSQDTRRAVMNCPSSGAGSRRYSLGPGRGAPEAGRQTCDRPPTIDRTTRTNGDDDRAKERDEDDGFLSVSSPPTKATSPCTAIKRDLESRRGHDAQGEFAERRELIRIRRECFSALDQDRTLFNVAESFQVVSPEVRQQLAALEAPGPALRLRTSRLRLFSPIYLRRFPSGREPSTTRPRETERST
jgi:hypothetical protein